MNVIHANFGGASAPPPNPPPHLPVMSLTADQYAERIRALIDNITAERANLSKHERLDRAEKLVQCAIGHFEIGGLVQMQIGSAQIIAASLMGAPD